jgi:membrane protease YdiL (CAAX protease family)
VPSDTPTPNAERADQSGALEAYSWKRIFLLWSLATVPMVVLTWLVAPWLIARSRVPAALVFFFSSSLGMAGQGALAWGLLRRETPAWTVTSLRRRLWLVTPRHPRTTREGRKPYLWLVPLVGVAALSLLVSHAFVALTMAFHFLRDPAVSRFFPSYAKTLGLMSPELTGQWWLLLVVPVVGFLTALGGEELFFRGLLLPRMRGRASWLVNALLSSLHYLYVPWMIPGRLVATIGAVWAARRYRSNWIPILVRLNEVVGLAVATLAGVTAFTFPPITASLSAPHIVRGPSPPPLSVRPLPALPACDPEKPWFSVDLRGKDVSALDLRQRARDLDCAVFDTHTLWPPADRLPPGFAPARILAQSRNPGLGLRAVHAQGVTGRGVGIGIIDMPLLPDHHEYASQLRWHEFMQSPGREGSGLPQPHMHGSAVASIAVGRTVGVAPEADLYFIATPSESPRTAVLMPHLFAQAIRRLVEINRALSPDRKIRAISLSMGWGDAALGCHDADAAVALARAEGIAFFSVTHDFAYGGLGRPPLSDPDSFDAYVSSWMWRDDRFRSRSRTKLFSIPIDNRTVASEAGPETMVYFPMGGFSWGPPFIAGTYALAVQVDPSITPQRFFDLAMRHARKQPPASAERRMASLILDPAALIAALRR